MNRKLLLGIIIFLFFLIIFLITAVILAKQNLNDLEENDNDLNYSENDNDLNYSENINDLNYQDDFDNLGVISKEYDDLESDILEIT
jgi:hypothetical protein